MAKYGYRSQKQAGADNQMSLKNRRKQAKYTKFSKAQASSRAMVDPIRCVIQYGAGDVSMKTAGEVMGIQINYQGDINILSSHDNFKKLKDGSGDWILLANNKTGVLLYFSMKGNSKSGTQQLFKYRGSFKIKSVIVTGQEVSYRATIKKYGTDHFRDISTKFNHLDTNFNDLRITGRAARTVNRGTNYEANYNQSIGKRMGKKRGKHKTKSSSGTSGGGGY